MHPKPTYVVLHASRLRDQPACAPDAMIRSALVGHVGSVGRRGGVAALNYSVEFRLGNSSLAARQSYVIEQTAIHPSTYRAGVNADK